MRFATSAILALSLTATTALAGPQTKPVISAQSVSQDAQSDEFTTGTNLALFLLVVIAAIAATGSSTTQVSDERLKTDIDRIGTSPSGLPVYTFRYVGLDTVYQGVMAQDLMRMQPDAVMTLDNGYMAVDYGAIDVDFKPVD